MAIYRYQTLNLTISINKAALSDVQEVVVSLRQGLKLSHYLLSHNDLAIDPVEGTITLSFSQEDTSRFKPGVPCALQINIYTQSGERLVSDFAQIEDIYDNLYGVVIEE